MIIVSTLLNHENVVMIIVRTVKPSIHAVFAVLMISNQYTGGRHERRAQEVYMLR